MNRTDAETMALRALAWLAQDADLLGRFMAAGGLSPSDLAASASDPNFLGAVMDFLLTDDSLIVAFCDVAGHPYSAPLAARAALPGGDVPHWT